MFSTRDADRDGMVVMRAVAISPHRCWWGTSPFPAFSKSILTALRPPFRDAAHKPQYPSFYYPHIFIILTYLDMTDPTIENAVSKYRYELLFGAWLLVTGGTFLRISKQPYSTRLKVEQYESIFKGTSLSAVLLGMGMTPTRSARRFTS
jgi:hypothetical protein